jgi:hypothetical protein
MIIGKLIHFLVRVLIKILRPPKLPHRPTELVLHIGYSVVKCSCVLYSGFNLLKPIANTVSHSTLLILIFRRFARLLCIYQSDLLSEFVLIQRVIFPYMISNLLKMINLIHHVNCMQRTPVTAQRVQAQKSDTHPHLHNR